VQEELFLTFPHYYGPSLAGYSTALLYHGRLAVPAIPLRDDSYEAYKKVSTEAQTSSLGDLFRMTDVSFRKHTEMWTSSEGYLQAVRPRLLHLQMDYPASPKHFESFKLTPEIRRALAGAMLDPLFFTTASVEFIWRIHGYLDACEGDAREAVRLLEARAQDLGQPLLLLPESFLNRLFGSVPLNGVEDIVDARTLSPVTNHATALRLAETLSAMTVQEPPSPEAVTRLLSFKLFSQLLNDRLPQLRGTGADLVSRLLEKHQQAIESLHEKCSTEAAGLVLDTPGPNMLALAIRQVFNRMHAEASEILELDKKSDAAFRAQLKEDPLLLASPLALLSFSMLSPELLASGVMGVMSRVAASAFKASNAKSKTLSQSSYALLYYIEKLR
jgi:hypothetical protein